MPKHVAISLNGEPTFYPHLGEFIERCHRRGMTTFLVTNGSRPDVLKKLDPLPTQLYVSVDAPNEDVFNKLCVPIGGGAWDKLEETIDLLPSLDTRIVSRHTLVKGWNMEADKGHIEEYVRLDERAEPDFVESKGYVFVGYSRERMTIENMPAHEDVLDFTRKLNHHLGYAWGGDRRESRVTCLVKPGVEQKLDLEAWEKAHKVEDHPPLRLSNGRRIEDSSWEIVRRKLAAIEAGSPSAGSCACGHPHEAHVAEGVQPRERQINVSLGKSAGPTGPCCGGH